MCIEKQQRQLCTHQISGIKIDKISKNDNEKVIN